MRWQTVRQFLWGETPSSKLERRLLLKLDWFILSYCCLMYFTNYLDRANVNNAYVSGMKQELNMQGNDFNKINTVFTCGYIVGMIPNNLMLQVVPPRLWFPSMQIVWGVLTFCSSSVHNVQQVRPSITLFPCQPFPQIAVRYQIHPRRIRSIDIRRHALYSWIMV